MKHYVLDENRNLVEAYSKEEVLAVLQQAINDGTLENIVKDAGFINRIKCCVTGGTTRIAYVTQAKYNELEAGNLLQENTEYNIIDDTTAEDIEKALAQFNTDVENVETKLNNMVTDVEKRLLVTTIQKNIAETTDEQNLIYWAIAKYYDESLTKPVPFIYRLYNVSNTCYLGTIFSPTAERTIIKAFKLTDTTISNDVVYYDKDARNVKMPAQVYTTDYITSKDFIGTVTTSGGATLTEKGTYLLNITYTMANQPMETTVIMYWSGTRQAVQHDVKANSSSINIFISSIGVLTWNSSSDIVIESVSYKKL